MAFPWRHILASAAASVWYATAAAAPAEIFHPLADRSLEGLLSELTIEASISSNTGFMARVYGIGLGAECEPQRESQACPSARLIVLVGQSLGGFTVTSSWETAQLYGLKFIAARLGDDHGRQSIDIDFETCSTDDAKAAAQAPASRASLAHIIHYRAVASAQSVKMAALPESRFVACNLN